MAFPKQTHELLLTTLADLGLNRSEITVFSCLLENESAQRVTHIARKTKLNRTTLYGILHALSERGLVSSVEDRGVLVYRAIQPHLLLDYIERMRAKLASDLKRVESALPIIERIRTERSSQYPSIQFFEGKEGIKQAYEDTIKNNPSKEIHGFTGTEAIFAEGSIDMDWVEWYMTRRAAAGVKYRTIAMDGPSSREIKARDKRDFRTTKLLPAGYRFEIEMSIYGNKVLIASFSKDHPLAVLIQDEKIAELMDELFRYIDSTLTE